MQDTTKTITKLPNNNQKETYFEGRSEATFGILEWALPEHIAEVLLGTVPTLLWEVRELVERVKDHTKSEGETFDIRSVFLAGVAESEETG